MRQRPVTWFLLVVATVATALVQPGPLITADASAIAGCAGPAGGGCVEVRVMPIDGRPAPPGPLRELQMNVCHSGVATCYRPGDQSTIEAAGMVTRYRPTVLTLNEICADDILDSTSAIPQAMARVARQAHSASVFAVFAPAVDRYTGLPYRCTDGDLYGIGMIGRGTAGPATHYRYTAQLTISDEERVAVCAPVDGDRVCTTHLESDSGTVAAAQCAELLAPAGFVRAGADGRPTIIGGDFNLRDVAGCLPAGWSATGDGVVQHVLAEGARITGTRVVPTHFTDHPALLVDLS